MTGKTGFEVIIIGGSYAGLSAAMSLGRALRQVLLIDSGQPCNSATPHSHNFLTQDGQTPAVISGIAREQVSAYKTVTFYEGTATSAVKTATGFEVMTGAGDRFISKKIVLATGIKDILPDIEGIKACWGISVIHCPYCHGYEVRDQKTGILGNGEYGFEFSKMISNWTNDLTLFTNGASILTREQTEKISPRVRIIETPIDHIEQQQGSIRNLVFKDNTKAAVSALYTRPPFVQHSGIPAELGCALTEQGYIQVDVQQKTTVPGVFACGDNSQPMRSVAFAVATGSMAGAALNRELTDESF
jgi:thioredoxin reductase